MMPPTSIDGTDITGATIDGTDVQEITVDGQTVFSAGPDIPTSVLNQTVGSYDFSQYNTSTTSNIPDLSNSGNDLDSGQITGYGAINGIQAADLDGVDDTVFTTGINEVLPITFFAVYANAGASERVFSGPGSFLQFNGNASGDLIIFNGSVLTSNGEGTSNPVIISVYFDNGQNSYIRKNGAEVVSGNAGTDSNLTELYLGSRDGNDNFSGLLGQVRVLAGSVSDTDARAYEEILGEKWGITL